MHLCTPLILMVHLNFTPSLWPLFRPVPGQASISVPAGLAGPPQAIGPHWEASEVSFASFHILVKMRILVAQVASRPQQNVHLHLELFKKSRLHLLTLFADGYLSPESLSLTFYLPHFLCYNGDFCIFLAAKICPLRCWCGINQTLDLTDDS